MGKWIVDSFQCHFNAPLDDRQIPLQLKSQLRDYEPRDCYDGLTIFCEEDDGLYMYDGEYIDEETGQFRRVGTAIIQVETLPSNPSPDVIYELIHRFRNAYKHYNVAPDYVNVVSMKPDFTGLIIEGVDRTWQQIADNWINYNKYFVETDTGSGWITSFLMEDGSEQFRGPDIEGEVSELWYYHKDKLDNTKSK